LVFRDGRAGPQDAISGRTLFDFIKLVMPRTRIAIRFRIDRDHRAFIVVQVVFETYLAIPALEFVDIVFVIGIFDMEFFTITDGTFGLGHFQHSSGVLER
jgi:hypothetical protein